MDNEVAHTRNAVLGGGCEHLIAEVRTPRLPEWVNASAGLRDLLDRADRLRLLAGRLEASAMTAFSCPP